MLLLNLLDTLATSQDGSSLEFFAAIAEGCAGRPAPEAGTPSALPVPAPPYTHILVDSFEVSWSCATSNPLKRLYHYRPVVSNMLLCQLGWSW